MGKHTQRRRHDKGNKKPARIFNKPIRKGDKK